MVKFRVVRDSWSGHEVQYKKGLSAVWQQCHYGYGASANTFDTLSAAKDFIARCEDGSVNYDGSKCVLHIE